MLDTSRTISKGTTIISRGATSFSVSVFLILLLDDDNDDVGPIGLGVEGVGGVGGVGSFPNIIPAIVAIFTSPENKC